MERPAQIWFRADDLANSRLAPFINAYGYRQSRQIAQGNTRFMNMLVEQLHVPQADAMTTAERLLEARLLEPLGGKYELAELPGGQKAWTSTALVEHSDAKSTPADYQFPALSWFRGIQLEALVDGGQMAVHGELIMPVETQSSGLQLPGLPFSLPSLGGGKDKSKPGAKPKQPAPSELPKPSGKREF